MNDIVERLRAREPTMGCHDCDAPLRQEAAAEIELLQAALERTQIGVNHIASYRTEEWPEYGTDPMDALEKLGAGREYDMWCCWNAAMCARDAYEIEHSRRSPLCDGDA